MSASSACGPGCEQKNIILLGCTQAGKSQFLKSLLIYGGFEEAASKVETGNGNRSKTQKCSSNVFRFELKKHTLHSRSTGEPIAPSIDHDPDLLFTQEQSTGAHIHLNIIDTPGLSDSENDNVTAESEDVETAETRMASVDEKHKISILVSLLEAQKIHAICLIKPKGVYSDSLQRYLRFMISIFRISLPQVAMSVHTHMIHTSTYVSDRFGPRLKVAESVFKDLFGMDATHNFVDSDPILDDPQSVYFSNCAIVNFLSEIKEQSSFQIADLKYIKDNAHIANDQVVIAALTDVQMFYHGCIDEALAVQKDARKSKEPLDQLCDLYDSQIKRIEAEIEPLNTSARILVNEDECEVGRSIPGGDYTFSLSSKTKIAYPVERYKSNGDWEKTSENPYSYTTTLSVPWMERATAWVKIYSLKSDCNATKITELQSDLTNVQRQKSEATSKLQILDKSISEEDVKIKKHREEIGALSRAAASLSTGSKETPYFAVSSFGARLKYFTAPGVYAASLGYGLTAMIPSVRLPSASTPSDSARASLQRKRKELEHALKALSLASSKLASRARAFDAAAKPLERTRQRLAASSAAICLGKDSSATTGTITTIAEVDPPASDAPFEQADLHARAQIAQSYADDAASYLAARRALEAAHLGEEEALVSDAAAGLGALRAEAERLRATFAAQSERVACSVRALGLVEGWLGAERLPAGAFAVLRQAALDGAKEPWVRLWAGVAEVEELREYRCGLENMA